MTDTRSTSQRLGAPGARPLASDDRDGELAPTSFGQRRLWFLDQLDPASAAYNMSYRLRIHGELGVEALRRALELIVERHQVLRTTFVAPDGEPHQRISPTPTWHVPIIDLSERAAPERAAEVARVLRDEPRSPFDLETGPLLRTTLVKLGAREHVLLASMHHIASDGWSMAVLVSELCAHYAALVRGQAPALPALPMQYADYARWQRRWLSSKDFEAQLAYWTRALAGAAPVLELPTDRPPPPIRMRPSAVAAVELPAAILPGLRALAARKQATTFVVLLAAFQAALHRWSGQTDILVGAPIAGRMRRELEPLIGFFVNTLVLRADLSGDPSFSTLLAQTRDRTLEAYAHHDIPFDALVERLAPRRALNHTPLFQVMFSHQQRTRADAVQLAGLRTEALEASTGVAKFDLTLTLRESIDAIDGELEYDTDLFDADTAARMARQLEQLITAVLADPELAVSRAPLRSADGRRSPRARLDDAARARVLALGRGPRHDAVDARTIVDLFEEVAAAQPAAPAAISDEATLTYAALDSYANQLARALRSRGVRTGDVVGVCLERSCDAIAALLAVVKAGGAYAPFDPSHPRARLRVLVADADPACVITRAGLAAALPELARPILDFDRDAREIAACDPARLGLALSPDLPAYIMYTSGSTGVPKGVEIRHGSVVRLVHDVDYVRLGPGRTLLQAAPLGFDASTLEIWGALLTGGACAILAQAVPTARGLADAIRRHGVTTAWLTAALFNAVVDEDPGCLAGLDELLTGGDVMSVAHAERVRRALPRLRLINGYGPTEVTTFATTYALPAALDAAGGVPIGRAIPQTTCYVLDASLELLPIGAIGELYVGGAGVAIGYRHQPALTAERFVPDPFGPPGSRLYRTGDLVRYREDGALEFRGRADSQVKVRGFRIEPGEIEATLAAHPDIRQAAVVQDRGADGNARLVAYCAAARALAVAELRAFVGERLPDYMVPAAFVQIEKLPLTPNGKLDRAALPAADAEARAGRAYVAPRTPTEEIVAAVWAQVLGVSRVGIDDDFFDLGGHSLLATQVLARLRASLGVEVPLRALFEAPTVLGLATRLAACASAGAPLVALPRKDAVPLSFAQERLWLIDQLEPGSTHYNIPLAVRLRGALDVGALAGALAALVQRHEVLRTTFASEAGHPVQRVAADAGFALEQVDLRALAEGPAEHDGPGGGKKNGLSVADAREARVRELARAEAARAFDLVRGPVVRAALLALAADDHVLLLSFHHIAADGWSMAIVVREVAAQYAARSGGRAPALPALPIQYADWAQSQRATFAGDELARQRGYWQAQLAGVPASLDLPTDQPRPALRSHRGAHLHFELDPALTDGLHRIARAHGATLYMVLLAAFEALLYRYTGQPVFAIGSPIAGRQRAELEGLIGFFVNTLVMRADLSGDPRFGELVARVRDTALGAYAHQDLPFERLVEELQPERDMSRTPLFQVVFALQNAPAARLEVQGLEVEVLALESGTSKFDLTLEVVEAGRALACSFEYATDLFDAGTVARMAGHLEELVRTVCRDAGVRVSEIRVLRGEELAWLAAQQPGRSYASEATLHELFAAQAAQAGDRIAVTCGAERATYRELEARANRLAQVLRRRGVGPEVRVAFCLERGVEAVVAMLGILKVGGAYVPIDPIYPAERRAYIAADSGAALVITEHALAGEVGGVPALVVDDPEVAREVASAPSDAPAVRVRADGLAYVIYTSGSTGRPKGSLIPHRNVVRLMRATEAWFGFGAEDVWTVFHSLAFDFSVWEVWGALLYGGRAVMVPQVTTRSPEEMVDLLEREGVTVLNQTPSAFRALMHEVLRRGELRLSLRWVVFGGEALDIPGLRPWFARFGERAPTLVNMYGITETTVHVTYRALRAADAEQEASVIGAPIGDLSVHVLDGAMNLVPIGVVGELYVGGPGCSRGYLGRPELTAERFVPDPFGTAGARLYRTGDLGRRLASGEIEYLGRADAQVKIRGFRIEPGEIESALGSVAGVREAAVVVREDGADKRLVGYVAGDGLSAAALRAELTKLLPEYMVPSAIVVMDALPLTAHGKVDRQALPAPSAERGGGGATPETAPATAAEHAVCEAMAEVLGVEHVGVRDNFFGLGGHSLLAIRLVDRLRQRGWGLSARQVFEAADAGALAGAMSAVGALGAMAAGAPPPNLIPAGAEAIRPEMITLVALTQDEIDRIVAEVPGCAANVQDIYPLTPLQEGFLYEHLAARERGTGEDPYLGLGVLHFGVEGELTRYLDGLRAMIARHDILRTGVRWEGLTRPVQVVARAAELTVKRLEGTYTEQEMFAEGRRLMEGFDVRRAPLLRFAVAANERGGWSLVLVMHHLIEDNLLLRAVDRELRVVASGGSLPPALPFRAYVAYVLGREVGASEGFWRALLADVEEAAEVASARGPRTRAARRLAGDLDAALRRRSRVHGVSLAAVFHVAFGLALGKLSGRHDLVFGTVLSGRAAPLPGMERAVGMFLSTLPVRLRVGAQTVGAAVAQMHGLLAELPVHDHVPLPQIQAWSPVRPPLRLFTALFNYRHTVVASEAAPAPGGPEGARFIESSHYPVSVNVDSSDEGCELALETDGPLAARLADALILALSGMAAGWDRPLATVTVVPDDERQRQLAWNATARDYPRDRTLVDLYEAQAARTPDAPAVVADGRALGFAELDRRANQLAHELIARGVGRDMPVGLVGERCADAVVALLAILKAGGAYVPVDPDHPAARTRRVLVEAGCRVVVRPSDAGAELVPAGVDDLCLTEQACARAIAGRPEVAPVRRAGPRDLAYVIFTSGSTGAPKGVMIEHRSVVNLWAGLADTVYRAAPPGALRVSVNASLAFDASVQQLLALVAGHALYPVPAAIRGDGEAMVEFVRAQQIDVLDCVPSQLAIMLHAGLLAPGPHRPRIVLPGGEAIDDAAWRALAAVPEVAIYNMYGPTECTVDATTCRVARALARPSIGRPLANVRAYVLDRAGELAPAGAVGELHVGGDGVGRGYLHQPALTAEHFVADPFAGVPGARMYRTGDRVRQLDDGSLEFVGRADDQVKLRGFRIELGEIEAVLCEHAAIRAAAVVIGGSHARQRLIAYCVADGELPVAELRAWLPQRLPVHMIPAALIGVAALPLTANGKIDRRALAAIEPAAGGEDAYLAPRTERERALAEIWEHLLGAPRVGVRDDFFALGGHSLIATRLLAAIEKRLGRRLALQTLYGSPTVEGLAAALDDGREPVASSPAILLAPGGADGVPLHCIAPAGRTAFAYRELAAALTAARPLWGVQLVDPQRLTAIDSVEDVAAAAAAAVRAVQPAGPYHLCGWSFGGLVAFEIARQLTAARHAVATVALIDTYAPAALADEPADDAAAVIDIARLLGLPVDAAALAGCAAEDAIARVAALVDRAGDARDVADLVRRGLAVVQSARAAALRYQPRPYAGRVTLVAARGDDAAHRRRDPARGWSPWVTGALDVHAIDATHEGIVRNPHVRGLAAVLADALRRSSIPE